MRSMRSYVRYVTAALLAVLLVAGAALPASAATRSPLGSAAAATDAHCGAQIIQDLGSVRPALWSDMLIANCNGFAAPLPLIVGGGGWRDAGVADTGAYFERGFLVSSLGGWSDSGTANRVTHVSFNLATLGDLGWRDAGAGVARPRLGALKGGAR